MVKVKVVSPDCTLQLPPAAVQPPEFVPQLEFETQVLPEQEK
jgi:hypothetical protein